MPGKTKAIKITDASKPWNRRKGGYKQPVETLAKKKRFLIVCEGQTEELYFKSFPVLTATIKPIHQGATKSSLVDCVVGYLEAEDYDEIWCVFDMDFKPGHNKQFEDFNTAIKSANEAGYKCAYSNDAFELWFVLHYQYIDQQQDRTFYFSTLGDYWQINYEKYGKHRSFAQSIYDRLMTDENASQIDAITHSRRLFEAQKHLPFHKQNPVTKIYELVEELNCHLRH